MYYGNKVVG